MPLVGIMGRGAAHRPQNVVMPLVGIMGMGWVAVLPAHYTPT